MTGEQITNVLEDALDFYLDPTGSWGAYPRASGLRFDVNEALPKGSRVSNLEVNAKLAASWAPIDMSANYTVVTNNYIAIPKDGYFEFGNVDDSLKYDTYVEYAQSFIEYAESVGVLEPVSADRASTQNWTDQAPETTSPTGSPAEASVWINELHYDNINTDAGEFIEIGCNTDVDVTGYQIVLYNGNGGTSYNTQILSGTCSPSTGSFPVVDYPSNGIQNGSPDGIALVDAAGAVIEFMSYEGVITATDGPASGMTSDDIGVAETSSTEVGYSLQLVGDGCNKGDFAWQAPAAESKGSINDGQTISCVSTCMHTKFLVLFGNEDSTIFVRDLTLH